MTTLEILIEDKTELITKHQLIQNFMKKEVIYIIN